MQPYFTGSIRQPRQINLSGASAGPRDPQEVMRAARREREQREEARRREGAIVRIQSAGRSFLSRRSQHSAHLASFQTLLSSPAPPPLADVTRVLVFSSPTLSTLSAYAQHVSSSPGDLAHLSPELLELLVRAAVRLGALQDEDVREGVLRVLIERGGETEREALVRAGLVEGVVEALQAIPPENKTHPIFPPLISLLTALLKTHVSPNLTAALHASLLPLPHLPSRIPLSFVTSLASALPLPSLLFYAASTPSARATLTPEQHVAYLGNLLTFGRVRVPTWGKETLADWITVLQSEIVALPPGALDASDAPAPAAERGATSLEVDSENEESTSASASAPLPRRPQPIDQRLIKRLAPLSSSAHLSALLTSTSRHPSTRTALFSLLATLLDSAPSRRDEILNTLLYSSSTPRQAGGGLIRELWRSSVRSSALARAAHNPRQALAILAPAQPNQDTTDSVPPFLLLCQLYSRLLLTLPDKDFHSPSASGAAAAALSLDEVVSFSGVVRDLAFALYMQEGMVDVERGKVPGVGVGLREVRGLVTRVAQLIHARDSRKQFTPSGHWHKTSEIDIDAFCQAAILEEHQLEQSQAQADSGEPMALDDEDDEDNGFVARRRTTVQRRPPQAGRNTFSKSQLAFISPRLGLLNNVPFLIPFDTRVEIFRQFVHNDRLRVGIAEYPFRTGRRHHAEIRRNHLAQDGFSKLNRLGPALKERIEITFIDEWGNEEAGIDGGGVFKEFLNGIATEVFDTNAGLWLATGDQLLYPNPHSYAREATQLSWYEFLGRIIGKALYEGILLDVGFAGFFLARWLGRQSHLDDLASLDPQLYDGLIYLKNYAGDPQDLSLNFTVTDEEFGVARTIDLIPNGSNVPVTRENRITYIHLMSHYRLNAQIERQCEAFFRGLSEIVDPKWLRMFNQQELSVLIGGADQPIDLENLQENAVYGGYNEADEPIRMFWDVVKGFNQEQRRKLLQFVTSCPRAPLLGFKELNPRFAIRDAGPDDGRLPTSSTCVNLLKLPQYRDKNTMRDKLLQSIYSGAGFDLS